MFIQGQIYTEYKYTLLTVYLGYNNKCTWKTSLQCTWVRGKVDSVPGYEDRFTVYMGQVYSVPGYEDKFTVYLDTRTGLQ